MSVVAGVMKIVTYFKDRNLPLREEPVLLNFCIHTEKIHDRKIWSALLGFTKDFNALTGKRIAVCVCTPHSPLVRQEMAAMKISPQEFAERVAALKCYADIGYHGHFYRTGTEQLVPISTETCDPDTVIRQIGEEISWFKAAGIQPEIYTAGWWFLSANIVRELERYGILVDASIRRGKPDTFGGRYLGDDVIPSHGIPFILPPSKNIVAIQSLFGPVMIRQAMKRHLAGYLAGDPARKLGFVFPLHDWDVPRYRRSIWTNIETLSHEEGIVRWADLIEMRKELFER